MMKLSIKNRIAFYSVLGIASLSSLVFVTIFQVVKGQSISQIDEDLRFELEKHEHEIKIEEDSLYFIYKEEWLEREHIELEVYPLFVELMNDKGRSLDRSPNLINDHLKIDTTKNTTFIKNDELNNKKIRQIQTPLYDNKEIVGYIGIAVSYGDTKFVLDELFNTLLIIFPILLIITFFTSKLISNVTIRPITKIADEVNDIKTNKLDKRVSEVKNGDELQVLSFAINSFLDRIDEILRREKQFTADASHQLRKPLSVIKGNLEILIRKDRSKDEYRSEIIRTISRTDEMSDAVDKLLILARLDKYDKKQSNEQIDLYQLIERTFNNYKKDIVSKKISVSIDPQIRGEKLHLKKRFLQLIVDNLISNAIKYAQYDTKVEILWKKTKMGTSVNFINHGHEINKEDIENIFIPFFRNKGVNSDQKGYGLGLSIVKKAADALDIQVFVESKNNITNFIVFLKT